MAGFWAVPSASWFGASEPLRSPTHRRDDQTSSAGEDATGRVA
jgi:hypothetical protein